jgi:branched-chain amino acid transport system ATP-binding protein
MADSEQEFLLQVDGVSLSFGGNEALVDVTFGVRPGEVFGLIGPNGAGKTSLLNCLCAVVRPQAGSIKLDGVEVMGSRPSQMIRRGIGRTFQGVSLQANATVAENVLFARDFKMRYGLLSAIVYAGRARAEEAAHMAEVERVLEFFELQPLRNVTVGDLAWGQQKLVEIARALASEPKLMLLDEPTSGMNREEKETVANHIVRMRAEFGITQMLIEHDVEFVGDLCDRIVALDFGHVTALGDPEEVLRNPAVVTSFVGTTARQK